MSDPSFINIADAEQIDADPLRAQTLAARFYTDTDVLNAERDAIFLRSWLYVAHESEVTNPGDYVVRDLLDQSVVVIRGEDSVVRCFHNVCAHRAHRVLEGAGTAKRIVCPYHAWSYQLDGRLQHARGTEGLKAFDTNCYGLKPVRIETLAGFLFANISGEAPEFDSVRSDIVTSLDQHLPGYDQLVVTDVEEGEMACNWKVAIDNTLECLHCHNAHPAFCDLIEMESYRVTINDGWIRTTGNLKQNDNIAYNVDPSAPVQKSWFAWLWPNTQIGAVPGSPNMSVFTVTPLTPDTLHWHMAHLRLPGTEDQNEDARHIYRTEVLGPEDTVLCESVQRGLHSVGYQRGRFVIDAARPHIGEHQLHYFQSRVLQALSGQS